MRIALGGLWLHEGVFKLHAGFGSADIVLLADSADSNSRVPSYVDVLITPILHAAPGPLGVAVPLVEVGLGALLVLGLGRIGTLVLGLVSAAQLAVYWSTDQLIAQYPLMAALSVAVVAAPAAAGRLSVVRLLPAARREVAARPS